MTICGQEIGALVFTIINIKIEKKIAQTSTIFCKIITSNRLKTDFDVQPCSS